MSQQTICPKCLKLLQVVETDIESTKTGNPIVFSCALCGHFLGISPYIPDTESEIADMRVILSKLRGEIERLRAALPPKKKK